MCPLHHKAIIIIIIIISIINHYALEFYHGNGNSRTRPAPIPDFTDTSSTKYCC